MTERSHRLEIRPVPALPRGLTLTDDLLRIAVIAGDLVNTFNPLTGADYLRDVDALNYVVSDHPWPLPVGTAADLEPGRQLRDRLSRVFRDGAYDELDALLLEHPPSLALTPVDGAPHRLLIETDRADLPALLTAQMALALAVFLADPAAGSLDVCEGPDCSNVAVRRGTAPATCSDRCRGALAASPPRPGRPARGPTAPRSGRTPRR
jgi:hypothetical protein